MMWQVFAVAMILHEKKLKTNFKAYADRELTLQEYRHYWAAVALNAFYYFCWAVYKGGVNEDDGFFFLCNLSQYE
mgnify:CR=1 FL=1